MRTTPIATALSLMLTSGCTTTRQALTTAAISGGVAIVSIAIVDSGRAGGCDRGPSGDEHKLGCPAEGYLVAVAAAGILVALSSLIAVPGLWAEANARTEQAAKVEAAEELSQRRRLERKYRDEASRMTEAAAAIARAGDCETVRKIAIDVAALDAEIHKTVFLGDLWIRGCFELAAPPPQRLHMRAPAVPNPPIDPPPTTPVAPPAVDPIPPLQR